MPDSKYQIGVDLSATGVDKFKKDVEAIVPALEETRKVFVQLPKPVDDAGKAFDRIEPSISKTGKAFVQLPPSVKDAATAFQKLAPAAKESAAAIVALPEPIAKASKAVKDLKPGANQAGNALTNLGRVAQDAPFGFIGIQNNINPLLESFQRLKTETGSTGGALKALRGELLGAAGVGLAISVVTGLVTAAIQKYGSLGNAINVVFGLTSSLEQANRDLAKSFAESEGSVGGELASINGLVAIAQNKALSDSTRQQALNKLNKEYDEYLPNLTLENINTNKTNEAVKKLTASLINKAKAQGLQDLISKETAKQAELLAGDLTDNLGVIGEITAAVKGMAGGLTLAQQRLIQGAKATGEGYADAAKRIDVFTKSLNQLLLSDAQAGTLETDDGSKKPREEKIDLLKKELDALKKVSASQNKTLSDAKTGYDAAVAAAQKLVDTEARIYDLNVKIAIRDQKKNGLSDSDLKDLIKTYDKQLTDAFESQARVYEGTARVKASVTLGIVDYPSGEVESKVAKALGLDREIKIPAKGTVQLQAVGLDARNAIENLRRIKEEFSKTVDDIISNTIANAAVALGEGIGNVFSGGGLKSLFTPLLSVIGTALQEVGKAVIAYGIAMEGVRTALENAFTSPAVAIAAGVAAVALGQVLRSKAQKSSQKFEGGGIASGPSTGYQVTLHGTEAIVPIKNNRYPFGVGGGSQPQELFAHIRGRDLYLTNQRAGNSRRRI